MKSRTKRLAEIITIAIALLLVVAGSYAYFSYRQGRFNPPDLLNRTQGKEVEDYFIEKMGMTAEEAKENAKNGFSFYVTNNTTLDGIIRNLYYYGIVKNEKAFREALEQTKDTKPGREGAIKVGKNGTIDISAYYGLKEGLTAWEVASVLLNQPTYLQGTTYNYLFMPGGLKKDMPAERPAE